MILHPISTALADGKSVIVVEYDPLIPDLTRENCAVAELCLDWRDHEYRWLGMDDKPIGFNPTHWTPIPDSEIK